MASVPNQTLLRSTFCDSHHESERVFLPPIPFPAGTDMCEEGVRDCIRLRLIRPGALLH